MSISYLRSIIGPEKSIFFLSLVVQMQALTVSLLGHFKLSKNLQVRISGILSQHTEMSAAKITSQFTIRTIWSRTLDKKI